MFRTEITTGSTAVAKLRKDKHLFLDHSDSIIGTDLSALATIGALFLVYLGNRDRNHLLVTKLRLEENMSIRLFYITVEKLHRFFILQR